MNKPVAWMQVHHKDNRPTKFSPVKVWEDDIPLYTHPVKELTLTKGEIHAVWASGSYYTLDKEGNVDEIRFEDFAKAILRKAQKR